MRFEDLNTRFKRFVKEAKAAGWKFHAPYLEDTTGVMKGKFAVPISEHLNYSNFLNSRNEERRKAGGTD